MDGAFEFGQFNSRLLRRSDVKCHDGDDGTIHGHRHRHAIQRNAIKEHLHVFNAIDGNPCFANISCHPWVITVIASVGSQVKRYAQSCLTCSEVSSVEGIAFLRCGKTCVLPDSPWALAVHARVGSSQIRETARFVSFMGKGLLFCHHQILESLSNNFISPPACFQRSMCSVAMFTI